MPGFGKKDKVFRGGAEFGLKKVWEKIPGFLLMRCAGDRVLLQKEIKGGDNTYLFHDRRFARAPFLRRACQGV